MKYLFRCKFTDGRTYIQREDDLSLKDKTKSAFYDVKDENIDVFWIEGDGHVYLVNLIDGSFSIDGIEFFMHDRDEKLNDKKLVYYRQHTHQFNGTDEVNHEIEFHFGWQADDDQGNNVKHIMRIK